MGGSVSPVTNQEVVLMQPSVWTRLRAIGASVAVVAFAVAPAGAANDIDDEMK